ncbi:MAG: hypothetical protein I8H75_05285 [Myxococcaceae bacterium]|nr:hypothetical protein [Myxococcaceae bacterium]MBH2006733.1 hypothetical protein [Myxococcaceae bacterium]
MVFEISCRKFLKDLANFLFLGSVCLSPVLAKNSRMQNNLNNMADGNLSAHREDIELYLNFFTDLNKFYSFYDGKNDNQTGYFVPANIELIYTQWSGNRSDIQILLGTVSPTLDSFSEAAFWKNSASYNTASDLFSAAERNVNEFTTMFRNISSQVPGAQVSFGPGDQFAMKSLNSLEDKIQRMTDAGRTNPVQWVSDALRGTIIVNTPTQMAQVVSLLNKNFPGKIIFSNKFNEAPYKTGYVGVHGGILYQNADDSILAEMQVHFSNVMDGGMDCPKEYAHGMYEKTRALAGQPDAASVVARGNAAQMIVYLFAMNRIAKGIIPQPDPTTAPLFLNNDESLSVAHDSQYVYRYDSSMLTRSAPINGTQGFFAPLTTLEVFNLTTNAWTPITDPEIQLVYENMLEESGDTISENTANQIIQALILTRGTNSCEGASGFFECNWYWFLGGGLVATAAGVAIFQWKSRISLSDGFQRI